MMNYRYCIDCNQMKEVKYFKNLNRCRLCDLKKLELQIIKYRLISLSTKQLGKYGETDILVITKFLQKQFIVDIEEAREMVDKRRAQVYLSNVIYKITKNNDEEDVFMKEYILHRDKFVCQYCGKYGNKIKKIVKGNMIKKETERYVCACRKCKKHAHMSEAVAQVIFKYMFNLNYLPTFTDDVSILKGKKIECYDVNCNIFTEMSAKLATKYVIGGSCKIIKEIPNKVMFFYPTILKKTKEFIRERDNYTCHYCGGYGDTVDHIVPQAKGGLHTPKNMVCACKKCNEEKGHRRYEEYVKYKAKQKRMQERRKIIAYNKHGIPIYKH